MLAEFYEKLKNESPDSISDLQQASVINIKVASVKVSAQIEVNFHVNHHEFKDTFLILPSMNSVVIGNPFFKKYNIEISPADNNLKLPDMTYQLNEIKIPREGRRKIPKTRYPVLMSQKTFIEPQNQEILYMEIEITKNLEGYTGFIPRDDYENSPELKLSSAVVTEGNNTWWQY